MWFPASFKPKLNITEIDKNSLPYILSYLNNSFCEMPVFFQKYQYFLSLLAGNCVSEE